MCNVIHFGWNLGSSSWYICHLRYGRFNVYLRAFNVFDYPF